MATIAVEALKPKKAKMKIKHPDNGATMFEVVDPETGETKNVEGILEVVGTFSNEFYKAALKHLELLNGAESNPLDVVSETLVEIYAACVVGWEDNGFFDEPYTPEGCKEMLLKPDNRWLTPQIIEFVNKKSHFFG